MNSLEFTIIKNLVTNDEYRRQVYPYLKKDTLRVTTIHYCLL